MSDQLVLRLQHAMGKSADAIPLSRYADKALLQYADHGTWLKYIAKFSFAHPDAFALSLSIQRMLLGANNIGSTCAPLDAIESFAASEYPKADLSTVLDDLALHNNIVIESGGMFHKGMLECEKGIYSEIERLNSQDGWLKRMTAQDKMRVLNIMKNRGQSQEQLDAGLMVLDNKVSVIRGLPGSGKTAFIEALSCALIDTGAITSDDIVIMAPTNKAASRATVYAGTNKSIRAKTIHRALGFNPYSDAFVFDQKRRLPHKLILIDEASMVWASILYYILRACGSTAHVVVIGDENQLQSIEPGDVLTDLVNSGVASICLVELHRSNKEHLNMCARQLLEQGTLTAGEGVHMIRATDGNNDKRVIDVLQRMTTASDCHPVDDVQFLSCGYKGALGVDRINDIMHTIVTDGATRFAVNDKVMSNENIGSLSNGDVGRITRVSETGNRIWAQFDNEQHKFEGKKRNALSLAYCNTIHKGQGSEYPHVILCLDKTHAHMVTKRSIYTAITRAKSSVIILGDSDLLKKGLAAKEVKRLTLRKLLS